MSQSSTTTTGSQQLINLDNLRQYFHVSAADAAAALGIGGTRLKQICRQHGIPRWPYRQVQALKRRIEKAGNTNQCSQQRKRQRVSQQRRRLEALLEHGQATPLRARRPAASAHRSDDRHRTAEAAATVVSISAAAATGATAPSSQQQQQQPLPGSRRTAFPPAARQLYTTALPFVPRLPSPPPHAVLQGHAEQQQEQEQEEEEEWEDLLPVVAPLPPPAVTGAAGNCWQTSWQAAQRAVAAKRRQHMSFPLRLCTQALGEASAAAAAETVSGAQPYCSPNSVLPPPVPPPRAVATQNDDGKRRSEWTLASSPFFPDGDEHDDSDSGSHRHTQHGDDVAAAAAVAAVGQPSALDMLPGPLWGLSFAEGDAEEWLTDALLEEVLRTETPPFTPAAELSTMILTAVGDEE